MSRPRVLTFVDYYVPAFRAGGPVRTIANLVDHLGQQVEFLIVTRDHDKGDAKRFPVARRFGWTPLGPAKVMYASPEELSFINIRRVVRANSHDILYLNSLFSVRMTLFPLLAAFTVKRAAKRIVVAPRGELSRAALSFKSKRKSLFLAGARLVGLYKRVVWQASSVHESEDIRRVFGRSATVEVAPNLPKRTAAAASRWSPRNADAPLRIVFLSRVSPMKNLVFALEVLRLVEVRVDFCIHGPIETEYWQKCLEAIDRLPENISVRYEGEVHPDTVGEVLASFDLFFLPTLGENYGHAIAEAINVGLPVLISDRTPWRGLREQGAGADLPLSDISQFRVFIESFAKLDVTAQREARGHVAEYAAGLQDITSAIEANRRLFELA